MLTLNLIRHAKTELSSGSGKDFDRQLTDKGIAQANMLGSYLNNHHVGLGNILFSSAVRTTQTCSILSQHVSEKSQTIPNRDLYLCGFMDMLVSIQELAAADSLVTVIGHNEGISELASYLSGEFIQLRTCELISLSLPVDSWEHAIRGIGMITLQYRPEVYLP